MGGLLDRCDADAAGSERASIVVYSDAGPVWLCAHHFYAHSDAFLRGGFVAMLVHPSDDFMPDSAYAEFEFDNGLPLTESYSRQATNWDGLPYQSFPVSRFV